MTEPWLQREYDRTAGMLRTLSTCWIVAIAAVLIAILVAWWPK